MTDKEILDDAAEFIENEFGGERLVKLAASLRAMAQRCGEPVASSACPICAKDTPHFHGSGDLLAWLTKEANIQRSRFPQINNAECGDEVVVIGKNRWLHFLDTEVPDDFMREARSFGEAKIQLLRLRHTIASLRDEVAKRDAMISHLKNAPRPAIPDGYALVPKEPTVGMVNVIGSLVAGPDRVWCHADVVDGWRQALAAAPTPKEE